MSRWIFLETCVESDYDSIRAMIDGARQVSYETMRRTLGQAFFAVQEQLGYAVGRKDGLRMRDDFCVSYGKSVYRGETCYFLRWSGIEHIFVER